MTEIKMHTFASKNTCCCSDFKVNFLKRVRFQSETLTTCQIFFCNIFTTSQILKYKTLRHARLQLGNVQLTFLIPSQEFITAFLSVKRWTKTTYVFFHITKTF